MYIQSIDNLNMIHILFNNDALYSDVNIMSDKDQTARPYLDPNSNTHVLTPRQDLFVTEYLKSWNATKAAIAAGYSESTAASKGSQLLRSVKILEKINASAVKTTATHDIDQTRIINELKSIAFGSLADVLDWDDGVVTLRAKEDMTPEQIKYLDHIAFEKNTDRDGRETVKIKVATLAKEKIKALELLGRHIGMFKEAPPVTNNNLVFVAQWGGTFEPTDGNANADEPN